MITYCLWCFFESYTIIQGSAILPYMKRALSNIDPYKVALYKRVKLLTSLGQHIRAQNLYEQIDHLTRSMASTIPENQLDYFMNTSHRSRPNKFGVFIDIPSDTECPADR